MAAEESAPQPAKVGFSFKAAAKPGAAPKPAPAKEDEPAKELITGMSGNKVKSLAPVQKKGPLIIPMLQNKWQPAKSIAALQAARGAAGTPTGDVNAASAAPVVKTEDELAAELLEKEAKDFERLREGGAPVEAMEVDSGIIIPKVAPAAPIDDAQRLKEDLEALPDVASNEAYDAMPILEFGKALLRGMGWQPGKPVGLNAKGLVEPVEFVPRHHRLGLGATPKAPEEDDKKKKKKYIRPGESRDPKPMMELAPDADGRVRHVKRISEKLVVKRAAGYQLGASGRFLAGPHRDLLGKIISVNPKDERMTVRLEINEEDVTVSKADFKVIEDRKLPFERQRLAALAKGEEAAAADEEEGEGEEDEEEEEEDTGENEEDYVAPSEQRTRIVFGQEDDEEGGDAEAAEAARRRRRAGENVAAMVRDPTKPEQMSFAKADGEDGGRPEAPDSLKQYGLVKFGGREGPGPAIKGESQIALLMEAKRRREGDSKPQRREEGRERDRDRDDDRRLRAERERDRDRDRDRERERDRERKKEKKEKKKRRGSDSDSDSGGGGGPKKAKRPPSSSPVPPAAPSPVPAASSSKRPNPSPSPSPPPPTDKPWLCPNIRVRIVSTKFEGGKHYNKKGVVVDVVDPKTCVVRLDESGRLVEGVTQDMVETYTPKVGGRVLVVLGKLKGRAGILMARNDQAQTGAVQLRGDMQVERFALDDVSEFVGDLDDHDDLMVH